MTEDHRQIQLVTELRSQGIKDDRVTFINASDERAFKCDEYTTEMREGERQRTT